MGSSIGRNPDEAEEDYIGPTLSVVGESYGRRDSLLLELRRYYANYAAIPVHKRKRANEVVEDIKHSLQNFLKNNERSWPYRFGNIMPQGSSYEGLKVMEPDEFDLLLPLMLSDKDWLYKEADGKYEAPGYFFITKTGGIVKFLIGNTTEYDDAVVDSIYLSPVLIKRKLQSIVQRAVNTMVQMRNVDRVTLRESGAALTLEVRYDNSLRMSIDIVPAIRLGSRLFVAKRHHEADQYHIRRNDQNLYNRIWRESYSEEEKLIIRKMDGKDECRRACLKILKTIRLKNGSSQLRMLTSYHLKTCMLHIGNCGSWHQDNLDDRFKDLLMVLIRCLSNGTMPSFFNPRVDLFSNFTKVQLQNIGGWLSRIIRTDGQIINGLLYNRVAVTEAYGEAYTLERPNDNGICSLM